MSHTSRYFSRQLSNSKPQVLPEPKFFRKAHVISDIDGNVQFTGTVKVRGQTEPLPSISAAKRWVRSQRYKQYELRVVE